MLLARVSFAVGILCLFANAAVAQSFKLDGGNTKIEFVGAKKDGAHAGGFKKLTGTATAKETDPASLSLNVVIDVDSLYSDNPKLTAHLKSPDFFEVKRFPEAKFVSSKVEKTKEGYNVTGKLTMHGKAAEVSFPADIAATKDGLKLTAKFTIDRNDWGISYGKGMINDEVEMKISVAATSK